MNEKHLISIVAPVKNEKGNLQWSIDKLFQKVHYRFEVIIVYDTDNDNSLPEARRLTKKYKNVKVIKNNLGPGVVNATLKGFKESIGEYLVMMAVDRTDDPCTINSMYEKIQQGYDVICPTRYSKGGKVFGKLSIKSLLSRLSGITTPYLLGIPTSDLTYSYKLFRKNILNEIKVESRGGFEFAEELVIKCFLKGYKICEVPTVWTDRSYGKSKFMLYKWLPKYIYWYVYGIAGRILNALQRK